MWQRFTERARRVVFFAQEEAGRLGQSYVAPEHLLLGLARESDGGAGEILTGMNVTLGVVRVALETQVARGDGKPRVEMHLTPRAQRVIDLAYDEARRLSNSYIGAEHLLLGILREEESVAARTLQKLGVTLEAARTLAATLHGFGQDNGPEGGGQARRRRGADPADVLLSRVAGHLADLFRADPSLERLPPDELLAILRAGERKEGNTPAAALPPAGAVSIAKTRPGDLGYVRPAGGRTHAELARTPEAFAELLAAYEARDVHGYYELTASPPGDSTGPQAPVVLLLAGTPLKALTSATSLTPTGPTKLAERLAVHQAIRVRVLGGKHGLEVGWLMRDAFARTGSDDAPFPPPAGGE